MTEFEQMFFKMDDFFKKHKVDYLLHGSTLLNLIRSNRVEPRENHMYDKELNFSILAEDFNDDIYRVMAEEFAYFNPQNELFPNFLIFFGYAPKPPQDADHWRIMPGFALLARYWEFGDYRVEYMGQDHCLVFPKHFFEKKNWGKIEYKGRVFNTPADPMEYFDYYFGQWKEEDRHWHWSKAECMKMWSEFKGVIKI